MAVLQLDELRWGDRFSRRRLEPRTLVAGSTRVAVVDAASAAEVELFADVLVGAAELTAGRVRYAGTDITPERDEEIGLVPAGGGLFPHMTVRENVRCGRRGISDAVINEITRRFALHGSLEQRPQDLTSEARARVAVARANCRKIAKALVVEDRIRSSCHDAVRAAQKYCPDTALVIVTEDRSQVTTFLGETVWRVAHDG